MKARVVFTRTKGVFPWLIRKFTKHEFNHVHFQMINGWCYEADKRDGVRLDSHPNFGAIEAVEAFELVDVPPEGYSSMTYFLYKQWHKPYDWLGIFGCLIGRRFLNSGHNKWYCSRLVGMALMLYTHQGQKMVGGNITPRELYEHCARHYPKVM